MQTDSRDHKFRITATRVDGEARIVLAGEIDLMARGALEVAVEAAVEHGRVILDLTDVSFLDSAGLAAIARAIQKQASVSVVNPQPLVLRTLKVSGLDRYIHIVDSEIARRKD
jgi:anti-anti-sigma factor